MIRKLLASLFLVSVVSVLGYLFWRTEVQYILPTPKPLNYQEVYVDEFVGLADTSEASLTKPIFYHFFTTNCPCSRFNLKHFNSLKRNYSDVVDFYVVIPEEDDIEKARPYFEGKTKIIKDTNQEYALETGVYSTPQAVIIGKDHRLYFRGNYNKARYCTDPLSNFAQMAVDSLVHHSAPPDFGPLASIAYGCGITNFN